MKKHSLNGNQKHVLLTGKSKGTSSSECKKGGGGWQRDTETERAERGRKRGRAKRKASRAKLEYDSNQTKDA